MVTLNKLRNIYKTRSEDIRKIAVIEKNISMNILLVVNKSQILTVKLHSSFALSRAFRDLLTACKSVHKLGRIRCLKKDTHPD